MYKSITDVRSRFVLCHSAAKEMAEAEETVMELAAVQAVYGEDCVILNSYPPHLHLHIKPRTANVSSQQVRLSNIMFRIW